MDDLISRQALLDWIKYHDNEREDLFPVFKHVKNMPSVQSKTKKGHWIEAFDFHGANYLCSNCGRETHTAITYDLEGHQYRYEHCPHCGADMRGDDNDDCQK